MGGRSEGRLLLVYAGGRECSEGQGRVQVFFSECCLVCQAILLPDNAFQKCSNCMVRDKACQPQSGSRTNPFCCAQCAKMKAGCNQEQLHMYEKFQANWAEMGLKALKDDFMMWYRPIVKKGSQFVKQIGDEDEERGAGKGKGCAEAEEEDEEEHSDGEPEEKQDENSGEEQPSPLKLRIPCKKSSTLKSSSKKPEDPVVALRARVEELESELVEEQVNTDHINERRLHYKERCRMSKKRTPGSGGGGGEFDC